MDTTKTSQPKMALEHLYAMCQSLKSTNRVALHIRMMHILYECVQTLDYFRFLHDMLEAQPVMDIDRDVDFEEWAQKKWIDADSFSLIWEDYHGYGFKPSDSDAKRIIDYVFPIDSRADRRRDTSDDLEMRKERSQLADTMRTNIDVLLVHSHITTTSIKEGIRKAIGELCTTLSEIAKMIDEEQWPNEAYERLADRELPSNIDDAAKLNSDVQRYRRQMRHEPSPRRENYLNHLRQAVCRLLESDIIDTDYVGENTERQQQLWETFGMEALSPQCNRDVYMHRLYILVDMLGFDGKSWNPAMKASRGKFLFSCRRRIIENREAIKNFYLFTSVVGRDLEAFDRKNAPQSPQGEVATLEAGEADRFLALEEEVKLGKHGHVFLALADKTIPQNPPAVIWKLVYCLLKENRHWRYKQNFKTFMDDIVVRALGRTANYNSANKAASRTNYINKDQLTQRAFEDFPCLQELLDSIDSYYAEKKQQMMS